MSFGWYLLAFLLPPVYFFACGRIVAGIVNGVIWVVGLILSFAFVGIPIVLGCMGHAMWDVGRRIREDTINRSAEALAQKIAENSE